MRRIRINKRKRIGYANLLFVLNEKKCIRFSVFSMFSGLSQITENPENLENLNRIEKEIYIL